MAEARAILADAGVEYLNIVPFERREELLPNRLYPTTYFVDEEGIEALADEVVIDGETAEKPADEISTDMGSSNISSQQTVNDQEQNTLPNDDQKSYIDEITGCIDQTVKKTYENSSLSFYNFYPSICNKYYIRSL